MAMAARSEIIAAESAAILRHARVIQIKRAALGLAPIVKFPCRISVSRPKKPRPLFIIPGKYARLMRACV
jgi:hypothetical protein